MRFFIIFLLGFGSFTLYAQENRSATELAKENIIDYITSKVFPGKEYSPVAYRPLETFESRYKSDIAWTIGHEFRISSKTKDKSEKASTYGFLFYLDKKMSVLRAESYEVR